MAAPVFDAAATSTASGLVTSGTLTQSWSHTVGAAANNAGIIAVVNTNSGSASGVVTGTPTASIGGTSLPYLGTVLLGNVAIGGFIAVFATLGAPTGAQTATYSIADAGQNFGGAFGLSFTYTGVGSIGALQTAFGTSTAPSLAIPSAVGDLVWGLLANYNTGTYSSFSLTQRQSQSTTAPYFIDGDAAGAVSVTASATQSVGYQWGAVGLDLKPVVTFGKNIIQMQANKRAALY